MNIEHDAYEYDYCNNDHEYDNYNSDDNDRYNQILLLVVNNRPGRINLLLSWQDKPDILLATFAGWNFPHNHITYFSSHVFSSFLKINNVKAYEFSGEIYQFLEDFDQHMEEEESIFQPLLNQ